MQGTQFKPQLQAEIPLKLNWFQSKKLFGDFIEKWNFKHIKSCGKKDLKNWLRTPHQKLGESLLVLYGRVLEKHQRINGILRVGEALPPLRTNRPQLKRWVGCENVSTINRILNRLKASGFVSDYKWHGSNSGFDLWITPDCLWLELVRGKRVEANPEPKSDTDPNFFEGMVASCEHTVTRTSSRNSKLIKQLGKRTVNLDALEKLTSEKSVPNSQDEPKNENPGTDTGYRGSKEETGTAPPSCAKVPQNLRECLAKIPEENRRKAGVMIDSLFAQARNTIYKGQWLSEGQIERGKMGLAQWFLNSHPNNWAKFREQLSVRLGLAHRWIETGKAKGEKRFAALPAKYFDPNFKHGLAATKPWYKLHIQKRKHIRERKILTRSVNEFLRAKAGERSPAGDALPPLMEVFRKCEQRLGKLSKDLVNEFYQQIIEA